MHASVAPIGQATYYVYVGDCMLVCVLGVCALGVCALGEHGIEANISNNVTGYHAPRPRPCFPDDTRGTLRVRSFQVSFVRQPLRPSGPPRTYSVSSLWQNAAASPIYWCLSSDAICRLVANWVYFCVPLGRSRF